MGLIVPVILRRPPCHLSLLSSEAWSASYLETHDLVLLFTPWGDQSLSQNRLFNDDTEPDSESESQSEILNSSGSTLVCSVRLLHRETSK